MKKSLLIVAAFLSLVLIIKQAKADEKNGVPMAGDAVVDNNYYGAYVSTVAYSTSSVLIYIGKGDVIGFSCATTSVNSYFEIYDSSFPVNVNLNNPDGIALSTGAGILGRAARISMYALQVGTSSIVSGGYRFPIPIRTKIGAFGMFSDVTCPQASFYYWKPIQ